MDQNSEKSYRYNLAVSLIIVLIMAIVMFYAFPKFQARGHIPETYNLTIEILQIPPTTQKLMRHPPPNKPVVPSPDEEIDILEPVLIAMDTSSTEDFSANTGAFNSGLPRGYRPRQLLEVVPEKVDQSIRGEIVLALKIGKDGRVMKTRVLANSTNTVLCETKAITAAKASLWESALIDGKQVEYWIEKTYRFNID